jgi:hypothetical protein
MRAGRPKRDAQRELTVPMTFRLPIPVIQAVEQEARAKSVTKSEVVRRALQRMLAKPIARFRRLATTALIG